MNITTGFGHCSSSSTPNLWLDIVMIIKGLKATWEKDTALQVVRALHCTTVGQALRCIQ